MYKYIGYLIFALQLFSFHVSKPCVGFVKETLHSSRMTLISPPYRRSNWRWRRAEVVEAAVAWLKMRFFLKLQVFLKGRKTFWLSSGSSYLMPRDHWSVKIPATHKILQLQIKRNVFIHLVPYSFCHLFFFVPRLIRNQFAIKIFNCN